MGFIHANFGLPGPFRCPVRLRHATDRQTDGRTNRRRPSFHNVPFLWRSEHNNPNGTNLTTFHHIGVFFLKVTTISTVIQTTIESLRWRTIRQSSNDRFWQLCVWSGTNTILSRDAEQVRVALQQFTDTYWQLTGWHCTTDRPHAATSSRNSGDVTLLNDVLDDCWASVGLWTLPREIDVVLAGPRHRQIPRRWRHLYTKHTHNNTATETAI